MRVSINENDPGFVNDPRLFTVYFNGKRCTNCVTADEEKGFVDVLCCGGTLPNTRKKGKVEIMVDGKYGHQNWHNRYVFKSILKRRRKI